MQMFYTLYFGVPKAVNPTEQVQFRKICPLPYIPPLETDVIIYDPNGEARWYVVAGAKHSELLSGDFDHLYIRLLENDMVTESFLNKEFEEQDEETIRRAVAHIEHLKNRGWEQMPDLV